jgi:hypothetical protein
MSLLAVVLIVAAVVCCGYCAFGIDTAVRRSRDGRHERHAH